MSKKKRKVKINGKGKCDDLRYVILILEFLTALINLFLLARINI
jgi:hypothetical protein